MSTHLEDYPGGSLPTFESDAFTEFNQMAANREDLATARSTAQELWQNLAGDFVIPGYTITSLGVPNTMGSVVEIADNTVRWDKDRFLKERFIDIISQDIDGQTVVEHRVISQTRSQLSHNRSACVSRVVYPLSVGGHVQASYESAVYDVEHGWIKDPRIGDTKMNESGWVDDQARCIIPILKNLSERSRRRRTPKCIRWILQAFEAGPDIRTTK